MTQEERLLWEKVSVLTISPDESATLNRTGLNKFMWWKRNSQGLSQQTLPVGFLPPYSAATPRKEWRKGFSSASYVWALSQFSWVEIHPLSLLVQLGPLASSQSCDPWWQILTPEPYLAEPVPNGNWILGATVTRGKWWVRRSLVGGSPKPVPLSISLLVNILRFNRISEVLSNLKVYGPSGHAALSPSLIHSFVKYLLSTYCVDTNCSHN